MRDLYERLTAVGFDRRFVREYILPDWWNDVLAENPANRAIAELSIARMLGFDVAALRNTTEPLTLPPVQSARLKHAQGADATGFAPAIRVAERMVRNLMSSLVNQPAFRGDLSAHEARETILAVAPVVNLESLLDFAWESGIVVLRLAHRPTGTGKLHGIAMFCDWLPAIVLTENRDAPPWQAFRLAHELGHIFLGHVQPGQPPIVDSGQDAIVPDDFEGDREEISANAFACELLTGSPEASFRPAPDRKPVGLALWAWEHGRQRRIDPGTLVLMHVHATASLRINRYAAANTTLRKLHQDVGAFAAIDRRLAGHLRPDRSETAERAAALAGVV